jgi:hypothetical protein
MLTHEMDEAPKLPPCEILAIFARVQSIQGSMTHALLEEFS